jgi:hypothetical protein
MNYAVEMGSAMICILIFLKTGSDIQKLMGGWVVIHRRRQDGGLISLLWESGLKADLT